MLCRPPERELAPVAVNGPPSKNPRDHVNEFRHLSLPLEGRDGLLAGLGDRVRLRVETPLGGACDESAASFNFDEVPAPPHHEQPSAPPPPPLRLSPFYPLQATMAARPPMDIDEKLACFNTEGVLRARKCLFFAI